MATEPKRKRPSAVVTPPARPSAAITAPQPQPQPPSPPATASWFDMFTTAPQLGGTPTPQMPQVGGGQAPMQPQADPLTAFLTGQAGQQQQPMIPQFDIVGAINALRSEGPVAEHNKLAGLPSYAPGSQSPFATNYFNQPSSMGLSPEAVLASQGNTATNQWAQMGGVPNLDPELLRRLNMGAAGARRPY